MPHTKLRPRMIVLLLSTFICVAIMPAGARAQTRHAGEFGPQFTFSPFLGVRLGGRIAINTPNVDYLGIHSSFNGGFNLGARVMPGLYGEFMWNRQSTTLSAHDALSNTNTTLTNHAHLDMWQGSLLYEIPTHSQLVPFAVAGIGLTHFDSHGILSFDNRFSYNIGGGVKYLLTRQVALRSELRYSPSRTTTASTVFCDPFLGCFTTPVSNHAQQWQANIGLEFRFSSAARRAAGIPPTASGIGLKKTTQRRRSGFREHKSCSIEIVWKIEGNVREVYGYSAALI